MSTLAPAPQHHHEQVADSGRIKLQRLVRRHDQLEAVIAARRSHGLPTQDHWAALVALEDQLAADHPRALSRLQATWVTREPAGAHALGNHNDECQICQTTALGHPATLRLSTTLAW